jgi:transcriptional regulator with XRE-family HTH domain
MPPKSKIGKKLKKARLDQEMTQADVAVKAKISTNYYARVERDEVSPSFEIVKEIAKAIKIKPSEILD